MAGQPQYAIGIDLGGGSIKGALVSADGRIEARNRCPTDVESGEHGVADRIAELFESLRDRNGLLTSDIAGIGIGVPGVTTAQGVVIIAPNLRWHHVPFKQILQARIKLNVEIDNDASVAAMGEAHLGAGRGCESLFLITLGTGIGLSQNPTYGMLLWIAAGLIALANVWWIFRASGRTAPGRK